MKKIKRTFSQGKELILEGFSSIRPRSGSRSTHGSHPSTPIDPNGSFDILPSPSRHNQMVNFEITSTKIEKEFNSFLNILKNNETDLYHCLNPIRNEVLKIIEAWYFRYYYQEFQLKIVEVVKDQQYPIKLKIHLEALSGVGIMLLRNNKRLIIAQPDLFSYLAVLLNTEEFTLQVYQDVLQFLKNRINVKIMDGE